MRRFVFVPVLLLACQPILIGNPGASGGANGAAGSTSEAGGVSGAAGANSLGGVASQAGSNASAGGTSAGSTSAGASAAGDGLGGVDAAGAGGAAAGEGLGGAGEGGANSIDDGDRGVFEPRVLVVVYDPLMTGLTDPAQSLSATLGVPTSPDELSQQLAAELESLTQGHIHHVVVATELSEVFPPTLDGFRYDATSYEACLADPKTCHAAAVDYDALAQERGLCELAFKGNADQLWLLGAKRFGFAMGKQLICPEVDGQQGSARTIDFVNLDYSQGLTSLLTSYQGQVEFVLRQVFGVPAANATMDAPSNPFALFVQTQGRAPSAPASGCGDVSFAPNSLTASRFDDLRSAPSYCASFLSSPRQPALASTRSVDCRAWGCSEIGFRRYWLAHLPRARWSDAQDRLNDFWRYVLHPFERDTPASTSVACSSNYLPGWCNNVLQPEKATCNSDEWATSNLKTGFVDFRFVPPRTVTGVQLYDRACREQVSAGHVEFSDGSSDRSFGPLDNDAQQAEELTFPPKLLSGLRVVIDASGPEPDPDPTNWNPGFGHIGILP